MAQTDYFFLFPTQAAAQADATVGAYWSATDATWRGDVCFPGLTWISSQSLSGWMIMISGTGGIPALEGHPRLILKLDRDAAVSGKPFVIQSPGMTTNGRTSMVFLPVPMGSKYPRPLAQ
jgi:hypothetical protein